MPTLLSCQGEKLPLNSTDQRVASANAAQKGTDSGEKRQCDRLLLVSLGESRLTVSDGQGQVASPTRLDALSKPWLNLRQTWDLYGALHSPEARDVRRIKPIMRAGSRLAI
jgi:hypothetical protein